MNKKILFGLAILLLAAVSFFLFNKKAEIRNYPSAGTDIIAFGDSLVVGVGATEGKDFVSLLSKRTGKQIINLGVSGNTTADGLERISELDKYNPKVVIILLGGNDYLRKVPIDTTFNNLEKIIKNIQDRGATVLLLGIRGGLVSDKFDSKFHEISRKYDTAYVSDVLAGLFADNRYMSDAIHPNDLGYARIEERIYPVLTKLLK